MIELDGRTGEGGGQLVRIAIALSSVCSIPVKITNMRGNRPGARGGGLKSQHVTAIEYLAKATNAQTEGLTVGSKTLEYRPQLCAGDLNERNIHIRADSPAASALLIFQTVFPFLLFAGNEAGEAIELTISGGTNVSFSLSYEYLDQVLLPALDEWFGVRVERKLQGRGWSSGSTSRGLVWFKFTPLPLGSTLRLRADPGLVKRGEVVVEIIDVSIITPSELHDDLVRALSEDLERAFPKASLRFRDAEESGHASRIYVLLVASTEQKIRWGRDVLYNGKRKGKTPTELSEEISQSVTAALFEEFQRGGVVDEFLQDQLVVFQALAEGRTSFPRGRIPSEEDEEVGVAAGGVGKLHIGENLRRVKVKGPLGDSETDSTHTSTARWVTYEVLEPRLTWYNEGAVCEGLGLQSGRTSA